MLVRVLDPLVVAFAIFVFGGVRIRIPQMPELVDEVLAFFIGLQLVPGQQFFGADNRLDVLDPFLEGLSWFPLDLTWLGLRIGARSFRLSKDRRQEYQEEAESQGTDRDSGGHGKLLSDRVSA